MSGSIYLLNDIKDLENDRHHPEKKNRPLAAGKLSIKTAYLGAIVLGIFGVSWSFLITVPLGWCAVAYIVMTVSYSLFLKHVPIIDIIILALGFAVRAFAGIAAINLPDQPVELTGWFITCVFFLALFIAICKRRHEIEVLQGDAAHHRVVLAEYSKPFLDQLAAICTTGTIMTYAIYAINFQKGMIYTLIFVIYGIFKYLHNVYHKNQGGAPETTLLSDPLLIINLFLWLASMFLSLLLLLTGVTQKSCIT